MKRNTIIITIIIALVATGAFAATAIPSKDGEESKAIEDTAADVTELGTYEIKPVNVQTATVASESLTEIVTATGTASPETDVTFSAEIPGRIEYLGVELGERVRKGQVLARIDTRTLRAQKTQAQANYELAKTTHGRLDNLGADLVSRQKLDETKSALTGAEAQLAIANDSVKKSLIRSTINGVVSTKLVDRAEYVAPGTPMFRVVDHRTIVIEAQLPETQVAMVSTGSKVAVTIGALGEDFEGIVDAVLPTADPVSRTFTVRIKVDNSDLRILVGMSANVKITARVHEDAVVLPQDIVIEGKDARSVFVAKNGAAKKRTVRLGAVEGDRVVILEGLESGEEVIVLGHRDLTDGQPIQIVR